LPYRGAAVSGAAGIDPENDDDRPKAAAGGCLASELNPTLLGEP
jgi:hypothetical protein